MKKILPFLCFSLLSALLLAQQPQADNMDPGTPADSMAASDFVFSPEPFYYDALLKFKGISANTQGFLFQNIYSRGWDNGSRFLQFIDGMDSRLPGFNFNPGPIGAIPAIDAVEVKLFSPADRSGGVNGALHINSKSPFDYPGLSAHYRVGFNHLNGFSHKASPWETMALRYAKVLNSRFAFKTSVSYSQGEDWQSRDVSNFNRINMRMQAGNRETDPAYDGVNIYGDEPEALTLHQIGQAVKEQYPGIPCDCIPQPDQTVVRAYNEGLLPKLAVTRTGYSERDLLNDSYARSFNVSGAMHYKLKPGIEASLLARWGAGSGVFTNFDRYALKNFNIGQYKLELKGRDFMLKAYTVQQHAGDSYNVSMLGSMINEAWKPSDIWMRQYAETYAGKRLAGSPEQNAHDAARAAADNERPEAGSAAYNSLKTDLSAKTIGNGQGTRLVDNSALFHYEAAYDFSTMLKHKLDLQAAASYRKYKPKTSGTFFGDADRSIQTDEYSGFLQAGKNISKRLKLMGSLRFDQSGDYEVLFSPGVSSFFLVNDNNQLRASYQLRYRNPSIQNQYLDYVMGSGGTHLTGGLPEMIEKYDLYTNRPYTAASYRGYQASENKILEEYFFDREGVRPENIQSFELGYNGKLSSALELNASAHYSLYTNYISYIDIYQRENAAAGLQQMRRFLIPVNISENLNLWGAGLGAAYTWKKLSFNGNVSYSRADALPESYTGGFNIPDVIFNVGVSSREILKNTGFKAVYRWQNGFYWRSGFVNGEVPAFGTLDAQISYKLSQYNAILKFGGSNLLNRYYITSYGDPLVGGMYYFSVLFDQLWK